MEELLKSGKDLRLKRLESVVKRIKDENGFIRTEALENALKEEFGSTMGGEYFMDHKRISGIVGIPALQKNTEYLATARAAIYAPRKGKNELLAAVKKHAEKSGVKTVVSVGGKDGGENSYSEDVPGDGIGTAQPASGKIWRPRSAHRDCRGHRDEKHCNDTDKGQARQIRQTPAANRNVSRPRLLRK